MGCISQPCQVRLPKPDLEVGLAGTGLTGSVLHCLLSLCLRVSQEKSMLFLGLSTDSESGLLYLRPPVYTGGSLGMGSLVVSLRGHLAFGIFVVATLVREVLLISSGQRGTGWRCYLTPIVHRIPLEHSLSHMPTVPNMREPEQSQISAPSFSLFCCIRKQPFFKSGEKLCSEHCH